MKNNRSRMAIALSIVTLVLTGTVLAASTIRGIPNGNPQGGQHSDKRPIIGDGSVTFGAYDPHGDFGNDSNSKIENLFLPWEDVDLSSLTDADNYAQQRGRDLLISVEPWSWSTDWRSTPEKLIGEILAGDYDANMAAICSMTSGFKSKVTIRWAQEMDEPENRFTWAHWSSADYVAAYRRMVTICRKHNKSATYMWSPKGKPGLAKFYPGNDVVDVVGLSVFGLEQYDIDHFGGPRTFAQALAPGYELVQAFNKPIMVAELGYAGGTDYVRAWAAEAAKKHPQFPDLTAVVYFNDKEVYPWPGLYGLPYWRVVSDDAIKLANAP
ncbi:beta-mannanase [Pararhizobium capsulatum DSM 1112]|uniref:Beta-mannanase n=1 Tax=Pararhizobium capsulatum DSM 1112 TaxID=1121113 RepID=A0ABU0C137_9HYPH|nr:glycosyl hydrolase [Pararhizobium capsulatum]MDQ0323390.1 beta-mannanase [Pararhizobium capsulatum DSM 1112]